MCVRGADVPCASMLGISSQTVTHGYKNREPSPSPVPQSPSPERSPMHSPRDSGAEVTAKPQSRTGDAVYDDEVGVVVVCVSSSCALIDSVGFSDVACRFLVP